MRFHRGSKSLNFFQIGLLVCVLAGFFISGTVNSYDIEVDSSNQIDIIPSELDSSNTVKAEVLDIYNLTQIANFTDSYMDWVFDVVPLVGTTVTIISNNTEVFSKGYGYSNLENNTFVDANESMFKVASISKLFVWTAIMQLWENGLLDLDADINLYLEEFQIPDTFDKPITTQNLMDHTSGFEVRSGHNTEADNWNENYLGNFCKGELPKRIRPPGEYSVYSSYSATLAAYIVQCVSNVKFEEYIKEHIFEPLGMNKSSFYVPIPANLLEYRATGYEILETDSNYTYIPQNYDYKGGTPAGSLSTTAEDISHFMIAFLQNGSYNGKSILLPSTVQKIQTLSFEENPHASGWFNGWYETKLNGHSLIGHGGISFWFMTALQICPELDFGIFISTNTPNGGTVNWDFTYKFMDAFFPDNTTTNPLISPHPNYIQRAKKFSGTYFDSQRPIKQFTKVSQFFGSYYSLIVTTDSIGHIIVDNNYYQQQFVETEENVFYPIDELGVIYTNRTPVIFITDEKGKVCHVLYSNSGFGYDRIVWLMTPSFQQPFLFSLVGVIGLIGIIEIFLMLRKNKKIDEEEKSFFRKNATSLLIVINSVMILLSIILMYIFLPMIITELYDWAPYPLSLYILLTLPLISLAISVVLSVNFTIDIIKQKKQLKLSRIAYITGYLILVFFYYGELYIWRLLGFNL